MDPDSIERSLRRGVWLWCVFSAVLPSGGITTAVLGLAVIPASIGLQSRLRAKITAKTVVAAPKRQAKAVLSWTVAAACGLGLYGISRLLFRRSNPLFVCSAMWLLSQVHWGTMVAMDVLKVSSEKAYRIQQLREGFGQAIMKWLVVKPRSQHGLIRYPLLAVGGAGLLLHYSFWHVLSTFMDGTRQFRIDARMWLRNMLLATRSWAQKSRVVTAVVGNTKWYTYRPLQDQSTIRLLKLLPRRPFGSVRCELVELPVSAGLPEYEALSYTWGQHGLVGRIRVEGKTLAVTPTVEAVLYHLSSYTKSRLVWIDQVCINQADSAEKECQIPLMRQIYQSSSNVVVWLDGVKDAFKARGMLAFLWHEAVFGTMESTLAIARMYSTNHPEAGWAALMNIFAHPWFFRVWVIQEAVLAPSITLLAAGEPINWDHLATFSELFRINNEFGELIRAGAQYGLEDDSMTGFSHFQTIASLRKTIYEGEETNPDAFTLAFMLGIFSGLRSTLAVDRFYGFLGLLDPDFVANADWLKPDYTRTTEEVYTDVTKHLILQSKDANEILSYAGVGYQRNLSNLPSWVPDWTNISLNDTFRQHFTKLQHASRYNASGRPPPHQPWVIRSPFSAPELTFSTDPESPTSTILLLLASGHVFDQVAHLSPIQTCTEHNLGEGPEDFATEGAAVIRPHLLARRLASRHALNPYPTHQPIDEVFWRTLLGDTEWSRPATASLGEGCRLWERIIVAQVKAAQAAGRDSRSGPDKEEEDDDLGRLLEENDLNNPAPSIEQLVASRQILEAMKSVHFWNSNRMMCSTGRKFCITKNGYMAVVPPGSAEGDWVSILQGINTPMVLRESKSGGKRQATDTSGMERRRVQLVGEAYVHGMMDGEAMVVDGRVDEIFEIQ